MKREGCGNPEQGDFHSLDSGCPLSLREHKAGMTSRAAAHAAGYYCGALPGSENGKRNCYGRSLVKNRLRDKVLGNWLIATPWNMVSALRRFLRNGFSPTAI